MFEPIQKDAISEQAHIAIKRSLLAEDIHGVVELVVAKFRVGDDYFGLHGPHLGKGGADGIRERALQPSVNGGGGHDVGRRGTLANDL